RLADESARTARAAQEALQHRDEAEGLRLRLAEARTELDAGRQKQEWLRQALAAERQSRQVLEAAVSANYTDTIARIRDVVRSAIPRDAVVVVVSKGDQELLDLDGRQGWHFPQA